MSDSLIGGPANPNGDRRLLAAIHAAEDVVDPRDPFTSDPFAAIRSGEAFGFKPRPAKDEPPEGEDQFDGMLSDDVPARLVVRDAEIDRVAKLNRAAPDMLHALRYQEALKSRDPMRVTRAEDIAFRAKWSVPDGVGPACHAKNLRQAAIARAVG